MCPARSLNTSWCRRRMCARFRRVSTRRSAAGFPLATLTAWRMVHTKARVRPGERVLIWGIGGGVAIAALQICKQIGAEVWVTSSHDAKLARAKQLGADHTLLSGKDVGSAIRKATGKAGVDVVIDNVGQATWQQSLIALGKRGRLVTCGATSGPVVETDVRRLFWNQWTILGSTMGNDRGVRSHRRRVASGATAAAHRQRLAALERARRIRATGIGGAVRQGRRLDGVSHGPSRSGDVRSGGGAEPARALRGR